MAGYRSVGGRPFSGRSAAVGAARATAAYSATGVRTAIRAAGAATIVATMRPATAVGRSAAGGTAVRPSTSSTVAAATAMLGERGARESNECKGSERYEKRFAQRRISHLTTPPPRNEVVSGRANCPEQSYSIRTPPERESC
jgi:hypothetical protein